MARANDDEFVPLLKYKILLIIKCSITVGGIVISRLEQQFASLSDNLCCILEDNSALVMQM